MLRISALTSGFPGAMFALATLAIVLASCGFERAEPDNNGAAGELLLESTWQHWLESDREAGACGSEPVETPAACGYCDGVYRPLVGATYDLTISRREWVESGNGLGDNTKYDRYVAIDATRFELTIDPPEAATVRMASACDGALRLAIEIHSAGEFKLAATVGEFSDSWPVRAMDECGESDGCVE